MSALDALRDELRRQGCLCLYSRCPLHGEDTGALAAAYLAMEAVLQAARPLAHHYDSGFACGALRPEMAALADAYRAAVS